MFTKRKNLTVKIFHVYSYTNSMPLSKVTKVNNLKIITVDKKFKTLIHNSNYPIP